MQRKAKNHIYLLGREELLKKFRTDIHGLSETEAASRLEKYGQNKIKKKQDLHWLKLLGNQFNNALVWILLVAAALALVFHQYRDMWIVLIIVFFNAAIGFFQEYKAERILNKIRNLAADSALVLRNREKKEISANLLVPGDIVYLAEGDNVPADGYLLECYDLYVNDFIFSGESRPNQKQVGELAKDNLSIGEMTNMVLTGSMVTRGEGVMVVTATGMQTELGMIAQLATEIHADQTPLQHKLEVLSRQVSILALLIGGVVIVIGRYFGLSWMETFLFALALSVSVVPEGLPAAISVALSLGMRRLLKSNVLAKKLTAVETLGSVTVICTDKTGTLTRSELMVTEVVLGDGTQIEIDGQGYVPRGKFYYNNQLLNLQNNQFSSSLDLLFKIGALCNSADLVKNDGKYKILGDPTEGAIVVAAKKYNPHYSRMINQERKINTIPFSSERRRMSVIYQNKKTITYVKGSPDFLIDRCEEIFDGNTVRKLTDFDKKKIIRQYNAMSASALRVLAFAYRDLSQIPLKQQLEEAERKLIWVGMMGMIDPPRADVSEAIGLCHKAGIRVMMITGDYEITAKAIAEKIGLLKPAEKPHKVWQKVKSQLAMTSQAVVSQSFQKQVISTYNQVIINGKKLSALSDNQIIKAIKKQDVVFARINPKQKLRIAILLKKYGQVIAMTGDGVNDALALKKADIGIAMGQIGTDVAKEAGDMILLDDNFSSIVKAIKEGRVISYNTKKFVHYVFTSNASELFTVVLGVLIGLPAPLTAIQILATDLGTDLFPSLALGVDPAEPGIMQRKPFDAQENVVTKGGFFRLLYLGFIMAACAVAAFILSMFREGWRWGQEIDIHSQIYLQSTTVTYAVISMTQMANLLHSRSESLSPFTIGIFKNRYAIGAIFLSILMLLCFVYLPFFNRYLQTRPISMIDWFVVMGAVIIVYLLEEARKWVIRKTEKA